MFTWFSRDGLFARAADGKAVDARFRLAGHETRIGNERRKHV
jgi:hypothetical protein